MPSPFPCSPAIRKCSGKKTQIEKKTLQQIIFNHLSAINNDFIKIYIKEVHKKSTREPYSSIVNNNVKIVDMVSYQKTWTNKDKTISLSKKLSISVFIKHSYFAVPKNIRLNFRYYLIIRIPNYTQEQQQITFHHLSGINNDFIKIYIQGIYKRSTREPYSFIHL